MAAKRGTAWPLSGQLRQALALAAEERPEAQLVVESGKRRHVRHAALEAERLNVQAQIARDARELAGEVHRVAVLAQPRTQRAGATQIQARDARQVAIQLIERPERLHQGGGG